jgi:hypothetical protein
MGTHFEDFVDQHRLAIEMLAGSFAQRMEAGQAQGQSCHDSGFWILEMKKPAI